jgi:hypothetical protein
MSKTIKTVRADHEAPINKLLNETAKLAGMQDFPRSIDHMDYYVDQILAELARRARPAHPRTPSNVQ